MSVEFKQTFHTHGRDGDPEIKAVVNLSSVWIEAECGGDIKTRSLLYLTDDQCSQIATTLDAYLVSIGRREKKDDKQTFELWECDVCAKQWLRVPGLPHETNVCPHCDTCSWEDTHRVEEFTAGTIMI